MAFTIVDKSPGASRGKLGPNLTGEAQETWILIADDDNHTTEHVRAAGILGTPYVDRYPFNQRLILMPPEITQEPGAPRKFTAELTWTSEPTKDSERNKSEPDPTQRPALVTWRTASDSEASQFNTRGKPLMNSAGEYFDPPIERKKRYLIATVRKNVAGFPDWAFNFYDCVNSHAFTLDGRTINTGLALMADITLGEWEETPDGETGVYRHREATFEIWIAKKRSPRRAAPTGDQTDDDTAETETVNPAEKLEDIPSPWQIEVLDQGLHSKDPTTGVLIRLKDNATPAQPLANPVCLDGAGQKLNNPTPYNAVFIRDDYWREWADFNYLPLT